MFFATLKRAFISKRYFIALIGTIVMCYICAKDYLPDTDVSYAYVIELVINLSMFKKIIVFFSSLPFVCAYCQDNNSKYINSILMRGSKQTYIISNIISCALTAFTSTFIGIITFAIFISFKYKNTGSFEVIYCDSFFQNQALYVCLIVSIFSLYCTVWAIAGLTFSSVLPDVYVALGSPLIFGYVIEELTYKMPSHLNLYKMSHSVKVIESTPVSNYFYTVFIFFVLIALFGALFAYFVKRRISNEIA